MQEHLLNALKNYYDDFYRKNIATSPKKIKEIDYFLNWLKTEASSNDISYQVVEFYQKECTLTMDLEYFYSFGNNNYSRHFNTTQQGTIIVVDSERLSGIYWNVFYSKEASTEAAPKKIRDFANELGRKILKNHDNDTILSKAKILECDMTSPHKSNMYSCTLNYPFPDKRGTVIRSCYFTVWDNELISTPAPKKK